MRTAILNVRADATPLIMLTFAGATDSHPACVERLRFRKVDHSKGDCLMLESFRGLDREVEPLVMTSSVRVDSHIEVVVEWLSLDHHVEVARLKVRVKNQLVVLMLDLWVHAGEGWRFIEAVRKHLWKFHWHLEYVGWVWFLSFAFRARVWALVWSQVGNICEFLMDIDRGWNAMTTEEGRERTIGEGVYRNLQRTKIVV